MARIERLTPTTFSVNGHEYFCNEALYYPMEMKPVVTVATDTTRDVIVFYPLAYPGKLMSHTLSEMGKTDYFPVVEHDWGADYSNKFFMHFKFA